MNFVKTLTLLLFLLQSHFCFAGWVELVSDKNSTEYLNLETALRTDDLVKMWRLSDYKLPHEVGKGAQFKSLKSLQEYDCEHNKERLISLIYYSESMGMGQVVYFDPTLGDWKPIKEDALDSMFHRSACLTLD